MVLKDVEIITEEEVRGLQEKARNLDSGTRFNWREGVDKDTIVFVADKYRHPEEYKGHDDNDTVVPIRIRYWEMGKSYIIENVFDTQFPIYCIKKERFDQFI